MSKKDSLNDVHNLNDVQRKKLKDGMAAAVVQRASIDAYKDSYTELVDGLADELNIDKGKLKKAIDRLYKQDFFDKVREQDEIEDILTVSGNLATPFDESE